MAQIDMSKKRRITDVVIDMTSWLSNDVVDKRYPYNVVFKDDVGEPQRYSSKQIKSGGMDSLLADMEAEYHAVPLDTTKVVVLCPKELLYDSSLPYSCRAETTVADLCDKGLLALDFDVTTDKEIRQRLETVLDAVVHSSCKQYCHDPKWRNAVFPNSKHRYDRVDNERAAEVSRQPKELEMGFTMW